MKTTIALPHQTQINTKQTQTQALDVCSKWRAKLLGLAAAILVTLPLNAKDIEKLSWLSGSWSQLQAGVLTQESWLGPKANMLVGVNFTTSNQTGTSAKANFEYMRIVEGAAGLAFFASPGGSPAVEFKLKSLSDKKVVFENTTHDFPQRVIYWLAADGALQARIEGTVNGKEQSMNWRFAKQK